MSEATQSTLCVCAIICTVVYVTSAIASISWYIQATYKEHFDNQIRRHVGTRPYKKRAQTIVKKELLEAEVDVKKLTEAIAGLEMIKAAREEEKKNND